MALGKRGIDISCNGGDRRDDCMGPPRSQEVVKFGVIDDACWAVVLGNPFDNTSTGRYD